MNRHKKIVITGASGFLGSHLVERFKDDEQYIIYALSSRPEQLRERIGGENIVYAHKDALEAEMLKDGIVINCAYPRNSTGTAIADGLKYIKTVFESAVGSKAYSIINISSQSVYSQQRLEAATEETPVCPESPYAVGKYAVELMLESICKGKQTSYTSLRMASLIGPGFDQRIVNRFVKQAMETGKLTVNMNYQRFGFFDIEDAVTGIVKILGKNRLLWKQIYNVGGKGSYTLIDIAEIVKKVVDTNMGKQVEVSVIKGEESGNSEIDASLFEEEFGLLQVHDLRESIERICQST